MEARLEEVSKSFGKVEALKDVNITARSGQVLGILGPSGCGKSTLLRVVAGLLQPDKGRVYFDNEDVSGIPPQKRKVGFVFQSLALFPNMTVWDNIAFGLDAQGWTPSSMDGRVRQVVALARLEELEERYPRELSGGQQQRVALARALAPKTRLMLLDEPLASLDASLRSGLLEEFRRIQRETGITTIYVTHDQSEAMAVSDEIALMFDGGIEAQGDVYEEYTRPPTERAARFLGVTNRFEGTVVETAPQRATVNLEVCRASVRNDSALDVGDRVTLLVRPEDVAISISKDPVFPIAGVLRAATFRGRNSHLRVQADMGDVEVVEGNPESFLAYRTNVGSQVYLKVDFQRAVVVKSGQASN